MTRDCHYCNRAEFPSKLRLLRNYGSTQKYRHDLPAGNSRLGSLQAAILKVKLEFLEDWNRRRFQAACRYTQGLEGVKGVKVPVFDQEAPALHVFHL